MRELIDIDVSLLDEIVKSFAFLDHVLKKELDFAVETGRQVGVRILGTEVAVRRSGFDHEFL